MRPDKKKVRHHDSRKREEKAKEKSGKKEDVKTEVDVPEVVDEKFARRNIASNWTKYEIPSSDENDEEDAMTGMDFTYALENAGTSDSLYRMKSELEWDAKQSTFTSEYFSLDLKDLETAISTIPLHKQIDFRKDDLETSTLSLLLSRAATATPAEGDSVDEINKKMVQLLSSKEPKAFVIPKPPAADSEPQEIITESKKIVGIPEVACSDLPTPDSGGLEQRVARRRGVRRKEDEDIDKLLEETTPEKVKVEKRILPKEVTEADSKDVDSNSKPDGSKSSVKNLEDWLDDFLDE